MSISKKIKIQLNGKSHYINLETSINKLLKNIKIKNNRAAIEVNGEIVDKKKYNKIILKKNDKIEIVHFIGGG